MSVKHEQSELEFLISALSEEADKIIQEVGSDAEPADVIATVMPDLRDLFAGKFRDAPFKDEDTWKQIREHLLKAAYSTRPYCIRCGRCCISGSPTLLEDDMELFVKSILGPSDVMTIRKGEIAYSAISGQLAPAENEMIKIREMPGKKTCIFYDSESKSCSIYATRPMQCRVQQCWNPKNYDTIADMPNLQRKTLLAVTGDLWEVIRHHEQRCSYAELARVMARLGATKGRTVAEVLELLAHDDNVRTFTVDKLGLDRNIMDFLFGRPMRHTIQAYGLKVEDQPDGTVMVTPLEYHAGSLDTASYTNARSKK